jgi:hypothetical protein
MTTTERILELVERLDAQQQTQILRFAEHLTHTRPLSRDELLAMPLEERTQAIEAMLANTTFKAYEFFEADDPIYDYNDDAQSIPYLRSF